MQISIFMDRFPRARLRLYKILVGQEPYDLINIWGRLHSQTHASHISEEATLDELERQLGPQNQ